MDHRSLWLRTVCLKNGLTISDGQLVLLERYVALLLDWNRRVNLISRKDEPNIWENHILHSISVLFKVGIPDGITILDLGTGGGLPGIPLKIMLPRIRITLLDSIQKKAVAVREIVERLSLSQVSVIWGRAEEISGQKAHRQQYDLVVARAVAPLPELTRYARPFLKNQSGDRDTGANQGKRKEKLPAPALMVFKGGMIEEEVAKAKRLGSVKSVRTIDLVFDGSEKVSLQEKKILIVELSTNLTAKAYHANQ